MNNIINFLRNRYCRNDEYNKFLVVIYFILLFSNLFFNNRIISIIEILVLIYIIYRFMSKNISKRYKENNKYIEIKNKILGKNRDNYVYKKCHKCKKVLRLSLPSKIGVKHVVCPKCKNRNTFMILRKEKIEVIKNKKKV